MKLTWEPCKMCKSLSFGYLFIFLWTLCSVFFGMVTTALSVNWPIKTCFGIELWVSYLFGRVCECFPLSRCCILQVTTIQFLVHNLLINNLRVI